MEKIKISTDYIKLDSFLKFAGIVGTGGEAKYIISEGMVSINDEICLMRGKKLVRGDKVKFEDIELEISDEY